MTTLQVNYLLKRRDKIIADFFSHKNGGLEYIYDVLFELPQLITSYRNQLDDSDYNKLKDQLNKYDKALKAVRALNSIEHVFS